MKRSILLGAILWLLFITASHIQLNIGWDKVQDSVAQTFGKERDKMIVGFLPVT
ncbi:MAG: hypothetical protein ACJAZ8_001785 [Planctomycetota bacterium]|jgi:hypothetical protein